MSRASLDILASTRDAEEFSLGVDAGDGVDGTSVREELLDADELLDAEELLDAGVTSLASRPWLTQCGGKPSLRPVSRNTRQNSHALCGGWKGDSLATDLPWVSSARASDGRRNQRRRWACSLRNWSCSTIDEGYCFTALARRRGAYEETCTTLWINILWR